VLKSYYTFEIPDDFIVVTAGLNLSRRLPKD